MSLRSVDNLVAHVVWATKGRSPLLHPADDDARVVLFRSKAHDVGGELLAAGCAADHVHVLVRHSASRPLSELVGRLKGASARAHNLSHPSELLQWQDGFWAQSCSPSNLDEVTSYILNQRLHHGVSSPVREPWEEPWR